MVRAALAAFAALGLAALAGSAYADNSDFQPTKQETDTVNRCLAETKDDDTLKQIALCVGGTGFICRQKPNTVETVACHTQLQNLWDGLMNQWYGEAMKKLSGDAADALKQAQSSWTTYRDAKCGYWAKRYAEGTFHQIIYADCMRETTGMRAIEMKEILDDASQ
jgi:uncharacterized protein YecT (DUF1311 family)